MTIIFKILNWIKGIKLTKTDVLYICIIIFILFSLQQCNRIASLKEEVKTAEHDAERNFNNYLASQDSIKVEKNKNGDLVASIKGYEYEINSLTVKNKVLLEGYLKQLNLANDLSKINLLLKAELAIKDSIINAQSSVVALTDSTYELKFNDVKKIDKYNWREFSGDISLYKKESNLSITSSNFIIHQGVELVAAVVEDEKGFNRLKITTPFPGVEFTNIENIRLIDDKLNKPAVKKAGWSVGIGGGYGFTSNGTTILINPFVGVGLYWSPKWLRF